MRKFAALSVASLAVVAMNYAQPASANRWEDARDNQRHAYQQEYRAQKAMYNGNFHAARRHEWKAERDQNRANFDRYRGYDRRRYW
ncbi:MAG TPA: hypothetical protein V6C72_14000 [Chroococcales cyanobacterium]